LATAPENLVAAPPQVRLLDARSRARAAAWLSREPRRNLFLLDLVAHRGRAPNPDLEPAALAVWEGEHLVGVASMRPTIALDAALDDERLEAVCEPLARLQSGLVRSLPHQVERVWEALARAGRRAQVDRIERVLQLDTQPARKRRGRAPVRIREAALADLDALIDAARRSLREEGRPDPFAGDSRGFRRWVRTRLPRALVAERRGEIVFVAYADVQRREGWLLQGVYTWPAARRQGFATAGVAALCAKAFASGASHVQLSVVEHNAPAFGLYEKLGFRPLAAQRTLLFSGS